ncbi:uncharacterized protein LTR77_005899 [Saxophila tyrrhenica]|uniref:Zinc finger Mcm10/DnaG-type domain-containing protein n=1 Tax=Saxophila tyrrhenica TaxID=1690608 RepID=A0AAV9P9Q1_9PEZI|nr:hypothetical protein LTR77_005899 [Saxophila tyrrhenica]
MVVVRESPRAKVSPDKSATQWPPKSPFQALLSSPSGRRKWQDHESARERSVSPSPVKGRQEAPQIATHDFGESVPDEDDEETLELQLQAIQTKLKLKRLQQERSKGEGASGSSGDSGRPRSRPGSSPTKLTFDSIRPTSPNKTTSHATRPRPQSQVSNVEVPLSPTKDRRIEPTEQPSPARRRLGLTAERTARELSLKRARDGSQIKRTEPSRKAQDVVEPPKLSFSERLNQTRAEAQQKQEKEERLEKARSKGFGSTATPTFQKPAGDGEAYGRTKSRAGTEEAKRPSSAHQLSTSTNLDNDIALARSQSTKSSKRENRKIPHANGVFSPGDGHSHETPANGTDEGGPGFDPFSQIHLSKRLMPHASVARAMEDREVYTLPRLLKEVKAPHYDPPDCESDYVVFAVLASKSSPFDQKSSHKTSDKNKPQDDAQAPRNKFMVLHLCDGAKWEVDCFLFGSAFDAFWKLTPGTLLAILNPHIMPPKGNNKHTGAFSLKLGSSEDSVLEIGVARDLGYCESVKKDGTLCGEWVDKRKTGICEFHLNLEIERNRRGRMEVNTMGRGHGKKGDKRPANRWNARGEGGWDNYMDGKKAKGNNVKHDREFGRVYSMPPSAAGFGRSAAKMLDAEDTTEGLYGMSKEEASRKRLAEAQKERDLAKRLGAMGNGVGAEYLRETTKTAVGSTTTTNGGVANATSQTNGQKEPYFPKPSAASLGLLANDASSARLSPAKDRRRHFGLGAISTSGKEAMGWGGARKSGLLQPKAPRIDSPEKGQTKLTPSDTNGGARRPGLVRERSDGGDGRLSPKKRARFALENKGIREPGRESLGTVQPSLGAGNGNDGDDDDDDDGLDIV